jgi:hypothetical protein
MAMDFNYSNQALKRYEKIMDYDPDLPRARTEPPVKIPPKLRLQDGREFDTRELLSSVSNPKNITLRSASEQTQIKKDGRGAPNKYSPSDKMYIATHSVEEIVARFGATKHYARILRRMYKRELGLD